MTRPMMRLAGVALFLLVLIHPDPCRAQAVPLGRWTGSIRPAEETADVPITLDVTSVGDALRIMLHTTANGDFRLDAIRRHGDTLTFAFQPPPQSSRPDTLAAVWGTKCILLRQPDGAYAGTCTARKGAPASMRMVPPR